MGLLTVRFGRIGREEQTQTKTFPNAAGANHNEEKLIAGRIGKGYMETVAR
jgi:predicted DNA-binding WGR domain protein